MDLQRRELTWNRQAQEKQHIHQPRARDEKGARKEKRKGKLCNREVPAREPLGKEDCTAHRSAANSLWHCSWVKVATPFASFQKWMALTAVSSASQDDTMLPPRKEHREAAAEAGEEREEREREKAHDGTHETHKGKIGMTYDQT